MYILYANDFYTSHINLLSLKTSSLRKGFLTEQSDNEGSIAAQTAGGEGSTNAGGGATPLAGA